MRRTQILAVYAVTAVVAGGWAPVFGSSLYSVGVLDPAQPYSEIRAVSQDGAYAVGSSTSAGLYSGGSPQSGAPAGTNAPVIWSVSSGLLELPDPNGTHCIAIGVAVGVGANTGNIIMSGLHEKATILRYYKAPLTNLASGSWADAAAAGGLASASFYGGAYNDLRNASPDPNTGWPPLGAWYTGATANNTRAAFLRGDPFVAWDGQFFSVTSISGFSQVVGRNRNNVPSTADWDSNFDSGTVPNSSGARVDGIGISASFGTNQTDFAQQWICGQVQNYNGVETTMQAFRWNRGDADMTFLGSLAPAGGGDAGDNSSVAYTVANNGVTAGRSYFGTLGGNPGYEVATVWDTSGTWDTTGTPKSLQALLAGDGTGTTAWTRLTRVYAASDDGKVLAGFGVWAADGSTRGFVAAKTATAPVVVRITNIIVSGNTVTIGFTSSSTGDTTASFAVQQAGTLVNVGTAFADVSPAATITGSAGSFQATFPPSGNARFYRIRHL